MTPRAPPPIPPERSLWLAEALADDGLPPTPLEGDGRTDVCIVGGGYTGLWTALRLKEADPSIEIALLESDLCGSGASGRNGGFVLSWWAKFGALAKLCGVEEGVRLAHASAFAVAELGVFCNANGIEAEFRPDGWLWAAVNRAQVGAWRSTVALLDRVGEHPFHELTPQEVADRSGSPVHLAGVFEPTAAVIQPARLARGLRRVALARGIRVYERSPVRRFERTGGRVRAMVVNGSMAAERVVLATNAWAVRFPTIRRRVLVVGSDMVATEPAAAALGRIGWSDGMCISDSRLLVHYYRTTADGRIAFGKGGGLLALDGRVGSRFEGRSSLRAIVERAFRSTFPTLADVRVATSWTGPIDRTRSGLPFFAPLDGRRDMFVGCGYSGNGVGPSFLGGRILASMVLGREDEWSGCGLVGLPADGFPPEPFRFVGGNVVRRAIERAERAEDRGRTPGRIARRLVGLAPHGLVPTGRA